MFFEELSPRQENYRVIKILPEHFTKLCNAIKRDLLEICYGKDQIGGATVDQDASFHTYKSACRELSDMLNDAPTSHKIGCIGELIMHLSVPLVFGAEVNPMSRLLSMSDRKIKHGFDLNYYEKESNIIWYGEVKSGVDQKRRVLLKRAKDGLDSYFSGLNKEGSDNTRKRWEVALNETTLLYCRRPQKHRKLEKLLKQSFNDIKVGSSKNALLMTVNFGENFADCYDATDIESILQDIEKTKLFNQCLVISAERQLFDDILDFIASEGSSE